MALGSTQPFQPAAPAAAVTIAATTTPASAPLPPTGGENLLVYNGAAAVAFVAIDAAATAASTPIPPGARLLLQLGSALPASYSPTLSAVLVSGSGNVVAVRGGGSSY